MSHATTSNTQRFMQNTSALPTLPEVAVKLMETFKREDVSVGELVTLLQQDAALAARLLRLANSARFGSLQRVTRLSDAANRIGFGPLRGLALGACLVQAFPILPGFDRLRFWRQNLATAGYARWLANHRSLDADLAEVGGLLMRTGELLMLMHEPGLMSLVEALTGPPDSVFELERLHFGCTHCELSAELAARWQFPAALTDALFTAADPIGAQPFSPDGAVLRAASVMADAADDGLPPLDALQEHQPHLASMLKLNLASLNANLPDHAQLTSPAVELLH